MNAANDHCHPLGSTVCEVPWRHVARDHRLLLARIDCGFPSPAADDLEEPIDLGAWLVEQGFMGQPGNVTINNYGDDDDRRDDGDGDADDDRGGDDQSSDDG